MKIHIDKKNNRIIANGYFRGTKIRTIAHCNGDKWNEDFGVAVAKMKYKIKEQEVKKKLHEKYIRELHRMALWCYSVIKSETSIVDSLSDKIQRMGNDYNNYLSNHFTKGE